MSDSILDFTMESIAKQRCAKFKVPSEDESSSTSSGQAPVKKRKYNRTAARNRPRITTKPKSLAQVTQNSLNEFDKHSRYSRISIDYSGAGHFQNLSSHSFQCPPHGAPNYGDDSLMLAAHDVARVSSKHPESYGRFTRATPRGFELFRSDGENADTALRRATICLNAVDDERLFDIRSTNRLLYKSLKREADPSKSDDDECENTIIDDKEKEKEISYSSSTITPTCKGGGDNSPIDYSRLLQFSSTARLRYAAQYEEAAKAVKRENNRQTVCERAAEGLAALGRAEAEVLKRKHGVSRQKPVYPVIGDSVTADFSPNPISIQVDNKPTVSMAAKEHNEFQHTFPVIIKTLQDMSNVVGDKCTSINQSRIQPNNNVGPCGDMITKRLDVPMIKQQKLVKSVSLEHLHEKEYPQPNRAKMQCPASNMPVVDCKSIEAGMLPLQYVVESRAKQLKCVDLNRIPIQYDVDSRVIQTKHLENIRLPLQCTVEKNIKPTKSLEKAMLSIPLSLNHMQTKELEYQPARITLERVSEINVESNNKQFRPIANYSILNDNPSHQYIPKRNRMVNQIEDSRATSTHGIDDILRDHKTIRKWKPGALTMDARPPPRRSSLPMAAQKRPDYSNMPISGWWNPAAI